MAGSAPGAPADRWLAIGLVVVAAVARLRPTEVLDVWWHLSMGEAALASLSRRYPDPVGPDPAALYTNPEWIFDALLVGAWRLGGEPGALLLCAALAACAAALAVALAGRVLRGAGAPGPGGAALLGALALGGSIGRFMPRPQSLFLVLLLAALLCGWGVAHSAGRRRAGWLVGLGLSCLVWSNAHSSMVLIPAVVAAGALPWAWRELGPGAGASQAVPLSRGHAAALAACAGAVLLGPLGPGVVAEVLDHAGTDAALYIVDMSPAPASHWWPLTALDGEGDWRVLFPELLFALGLFTSLRLRAAPPGPAALGLLGLALALTARRFFPAWALLSLPWAAWALSRLPARPGLYRAGAALTAAALLAGAGRAGLLQPRILKGGAPADLAAVLERQPAGGLLFNDYDAGAYLGWRLRGRARVFIDGRTPTHFGGEHYYASRAASADPAIFERLDEAYGFSAAVVHEAEPLCGALDRSEEWQLGWVGDDFVLFLPAGAGAAETGLPALPGCAGAFTWLELSRRGEGLARALLAAARGVPGAGEVARRGALIALEGDPLDLAAAGELLDLAAQADPAHPDRAWLEALYALRAGQLEEAERWLKRLPVGHAGGDLVALSLLEARGRWDRVRARAEAAAAIQRDRTPLQVRLSLARACEALGDPRCALEQGLRAALAGSGEGREIAVRARAAGGVPEGDRGLVEALLGP